MMMLLVLSSHIGGILGNIVPSFLEKERRALSIITVICLAVKEKAGVSLYPLMSLMLWNGP